jgi:pentatricopeptide repeat protein
MRFLLLMPPALLDVRTYNMAIKACMVARDLRTAMMITHTMTERKVALDIKHATTLMSGDLGLQQEEVQRSSQ